MKAERNGNAAKWVAISIGLAMALAGWVYSLGVQGERLKHNCDEDIKIQSQVPLIDNRVTRMEENIKSINSSIAEQKTIQRQILDIQNKILQELRQ